MLFSFLKKIQVVIVQSSEELNKKEGGTPSGKKLIVIKEYDITEGSTNHKILRLSPIKHWKSRLREY